MSSSLEYWTTTAPMALVIALAIIFRWNAMLKSELLKSSECLKIFYSAMFFILQLSLVKAIYDSLRALGGVENVGKSWMDFGIKSGLTALVVYPALNLVILGSSKIIANLVWWIIDKKVPFKKFIWNNDLSWNRRKLRKVLGKQSLRIENIIEKVLLRKQIVSEDAEIQVADKRKLLRELAEIEKNGVEIRNDLIELSRVLEGEIHSKSNKTSEEVTHIKNSIKDFLEEFYNFDEKQNY